MIPGLEGLFTSEELKYLGITCDSGMVARYYLVICSGLVSYFVSHRISPSENHDLDFSSTHPFDMFKKI